MENVSWTKYLISLKAHVGTNELKLRLAVNKPAPRNFQKQMKVDKPIWGAAKA